ncbi:MAG: ClC family H(+)/Cl(-) exchange transporter [Eubacteriales bacterium]|nr:ClC family H(+)/Cl(-) exchange transporter [Eubacteriales bacterium]
MQPIMIGKRDRIDDIKLILEALVIGTFAGLIAVMYRFLLHHIEDFLSWFPGVVRENGLYILAMFIGLVFLGLIVGAIGKWERYCGGSGIPQVRAEIKGYINPNPLRILVAKIVGGAFSVLGGLSVGREGPSIQMGAMAGKTVARVLKRKPTTEKYLLTCGASAGLAAAFNAPVAGVLFSLEEIHHHFSRKLLISSITATVTADFISKLFVGARPVFTFKLQEQIAFSHYWMIIVLGVILAVLGILYKRLMEIFHGFYDRLRLPAQVKTVLPFLVSGLLVLFLPQVLGGGGIMIKAMISGSTTIKMMLLLFVVKLIFSVFSFSSGVPGGIFFPILILGSTTGMIFAQIVAPNYTESFIILAMAGFLTAVVRAPLTSIILIFEMTGRLNYLLPVSIVCLIAYAVTNWSGSLPIYDYLLGRLLNGNKTKDIISTHPTMIHAVVQPGCCLAGKRIADVDWPREALIVEIHRSPYEIIPHGDTVIHTGDVLHIIVAHHELATVQGMIHRLCINEVEGGNE